MDLITRSPLISRINADLTIADAINIILNTTTGTKIGTATSQKLGFWNKTPIIQPAASLQGAITDNSGGTGTTVGAISGSGADAALNNNFKAISNLLLAIRTALINAGSMKGAA